MTAVHRATLVWTAALMAATASGSEEDPAFRQPVVKTGPASATIGSVSQRPFLHPWLTERLAAKIRETIGVALRRLRSHPSCQAMFARFYADGVEELNARRYYPAGRKQEKKYRRGTTHTVTQSPRW
jgi:hypothetical protein